MTKGLPTDIDIDIDIETSTRAGGGLRAERRTGSRAAIALPVMCRYESVLDFVETQSMNISESGMFIATRTPAPVGSKVDFNFSLADGFTLLAGTAEVMRTVTSGPARGMGIRFLDLDRANRALIARIVEVNEREGRTATTDLDFAAGPARPPVPTTATGSATATAPGSGPAPFSELDRPIQFNGRAVRITLGPLTVPHFTQNPLLNVRSGGFFIPAEEDFPLGTLFLVEVVDARGHTVIAGKGKVVAKQDLRVGIRLADVDKEGLARLRAEVEKFGSAK